MVADNPPVIRTNRPARMWFALAFVAGCCFVGGLAVSRLLYEGLFPTGGWLGRPVGAIGLGLLAAAVGFIVWRWINGSPASRRPLWGAGETPAIRWVGFLPLLLNLVWLVDPAVDLARGRFLFAAGLWLMAVLLLYGRLGDDASRWRWLGPLCVVAALAPVYLLSMSPAVGVADTFEFQVVAPQLGIAHPTGYPLYLLLGKLFSLLPFGTVAWRLNLVSAVCAVAAAAVVFRIGLELLRRPLPALVGAVALGLVPIYWSQAIVAEVYALHALIVAAALWLMVRLTTDDRPQTTDYRRQTTDHRANDERRTTNDEFRESATDHGSYPTDLLNTDLLTTDRGLSSVVRGQFPDRKTMVALAFLLGLGLANHLTTLFLLPPAAVAVVLHLWPTLRGGQRAVSRRRSLALLALQLSLAFALALLLYLYLPLRWAAVNGEPMGLGRFVDWVAGGRFQGALQWAAWLRDPTRRQIVGRLLLDAWGWFYLGLAALGLVWTFWRQWRVGLVLLLTAAGFTFYALNYYVPDLAVFLIPTHVVIAVWLAAGVHAVLETEFFLKNSVSMGGEEAHAKTQSRKEKEALSFAPFASLREVFFIIFLVPALLAAGGQWSAVDQSARDGGETWARGVLALPLAQGAAVLADSEKIAPLYYLQQIEGLRSDLDIMVLPDEAAYRAELDARLAAGQPVYLARYLPGLEGVYHLRSAGPLVEVSTEPLSELPDEAIPAGLTFGPLRLLGYVAEPAAAIDPAAVGLTLYWTRERELAAGERTPVVYVRWGGGAPVVVGPHPANDSYPVNAWRPGEIVPDFHLLPLPNSATGEKERLGDWEIEVAVAPRFTPAAELAWQPMATVPVAPRSGPVGAARRAFLDGFALDGVEFPSAARPAETLPLRFSGFGAGEDVSFLLVPPHAVSSFVFPASGAPPLGGFGGESSIFGSTVEPSAESGVLSLIALPAGEQRAVCGWLAWPTTGCVVAEIKMSGVALPEGATNFDDQIALLDVEVGPGSLTPGGQLPVTITWQGLAEMDENYTVFVQVLDAADRIVGQVDSWPVQGTRPTSGWPPGETIVDPYVVQLSPDMTPGDYRVIVGLYLLATGQRLPVLDEAGNAIDDKVELAVFFD